MENSRNTEEQPKSRARKLYEWISGRIPSQITITPTIAITVTFTLTATLAMSVYGIINLLFLDTGWEVANAQASTAYSVLISQDVVIEETLEVQRDLSVQDDLRILGSVLEMAGSSCTSEGLSPADTMRLCYEEVDGRLKLSEDGGPYIPLLVDGDTFDPPQVLEGPVGPPGPPGPPGQDGMNCWDLNSDGIPGPGEDVNRDSVVNVMDCRGAAVAGLAGADGLNCWDLDGDGNSDSFEDINRDLQVSALDCRGPEGPPGQAGASGQDGVNCWDLNGNGRRDPSEDSNRDGFTDIFDCRGASLPSMHGLVDLPVRQQCAEVVLSSDIRNASANNPDLITVQVTPRGRWWPLYADVKLPSVFICQPDGSGGQVDYDIRVVR